MIGGGNIVQYGQPKSLFSFKNHPSHRCRSLANFNKNLPAYCIYGQYQLIENVIIMSLGIGVPLRSLFSGAKWAL